MVKAIILIEAKVLQASVLFASIKDLRFTEGRIVQVDTVTGPYDVILTLEAPSMDDLTNMMFNQVLDLEGLNKTNTCLVLPN